MKYYQILLFSTCILWLGACQKDITPGATTGTLKITFVNTVKGGPMVYNSTTYANPFGELYSISKFKYYVSNIGVNTASATWKEPDSYHLVDQGTDSSLSFTLQPSTGSYQSLSFMLGVDSIRNVSGAQTGALDPTNDMFWTWSTGYIMAKLEGNSPSSAQVNNKIEYHIGGFAGADNIVKTITLSFPAGLILRIREGKISELIIRADLDAWWQTPNDISIATNPVCMTPGTLAKKIADNYSKMFVVGDVINY
jgi:hypothetical protein